MIAYLKGKIVLKNLRSAVVVVNDVGYEVFLSAKNLEVLKKNDEKEFYTHEYLREDSRELYGFMSLAELNFFRQLLSVSGVGPKSAMNILSIADLEDLRAAIQNGSLTLLTSGSGVGTKTAQKIILELNELGPEFLLFRMRNYTVYCAPSKCIPNILLEIGRLREITFRQVGEGTNRSNDLDEFDLYYSQMFIWDTETQMIAGAYRIGKGAEILHKYGVRGFYIQSLFRIKDDLHDMLEQTMELGRSFVVQEYQKKPMPLFLLWKGILYFTLKNPEYRYWMGPVSISDEYSSTSKEMIIKFIMTHHFDWRLAKSIIPRNSYKFKTDDQNLSVIMQTMDNDINSLDKFIGDVDEMNSGLPVLLKKYIKLNAKIIGFNVDPKFNNCLDGLIALDTFDIPVNTIESFSKEINDGSLLEQFFSNREKTS